MLDRTRIVTYSLLAHINDNKVGIKDLSEIFVPLVAKVLVTMYSKGNRTGQLTDLKALVDELYSLDVPYPLLALLLRRVAVEYSSDERVDLIVHKDNSFILRQCGLSEFEDLLRKQEAELDWLEGRYKSFLEAQGTDGDNEISLYEFLDQNRLELSEYMSRHVDVPRSDTFAKQAEFVNSVSHDSREFVVLRKIYLGSIISGYLEMRVQLTRKHEVELLLDTSFIVGLVGLASTESQHTCTSVVEIAKVLGYRLVALNITIDETTSLLRRVAATLDKSIFTAHLNPESIECACERRSITTTELERIARSLPAHLRMDHGITIIEVTPKLFERAKTSTIYAQTISRKHNPDGAPHDGLAYYYTQKHRGRSFKNYDEVNCWFVGNSPYKDQHELRSHDGSLNERIHASYLVNILWLTNPNALSSDFGEQGLTRLVATTMREELPNPSLLYELDENIKRCSLSGIKPGDLAILASSNAAKAAENLKRLNQAANSSTDEFCVEVNRLVKQAREERSQELASDRQKVEESQRSLENEKHLRIKAEQQVSALESSTKLLTTQIDDDKTILVEARSRIETLKRLMVEKEKDRKHRDLVRSVAWRSFWGFILLIVIEGIIVYLVGLFGEGLNLFQKLTKAWQWPSLAFAGVLAVYRYLLMGRERMLLLKWWKGETDQLD